MKDEQLDDLFRAMREEPLDGSMVRRRVIEQLEGRRRWTWAGWAIAAAAAAILLATGLRSKPAEIAPPAPLMASIPNIPPAAPPLKVHRRVHPRRPARSEQVTIKLVTEDPNVVIYLLSDTKGE